MEVGYAVTLLRGAVLQILLIAGPILIVGMGVGLIVAIFQATTSIQDQTLSFIPKIAAIMLAVFLIGPWAANVFLRFVIDLFRQIPQMVR